MGNAHDEAVPTASLEENWKMRGQQASFLMFGVALWAIADRGST
jgi:hypothetical protein